MNILTTWLKALTSSNKPNRGAVTAPLLNAYPRLSIYYSEQASAFKNWVSVCLFKRADGIAKIANRAATTNDFKPLSNEHWLTQLLVAPNKPAQITWVQTKKQIVYYLDSTGNAFIWMPRNLGGNLIMQYPTQMWVLPTQCVSVNTGRNGQLIESYTVTIGTNVITIDPSEICHIKTLKPSNTFERNFLLGSPLLLQAAIDAIQVDDNVRSYIKKQFENQLIEPMTINQSGEDELSDESIAQLKETLKNELVNRNIAAVLPKGTALVPVPSNNIGAGAVQTSISNESNIKLIAGAFNIPYGMLDTSSQQNVATSETNERAFQLECLEPLMTDIEAALSSYLSQFDPNICIIHDQYKYVDRAFQLSENKFYLDYGIKTRNELRKECGLPPIEGGNEPLLPMGLQTWEGMKAEATATIEAPKTFPAQTTPTNEPQEEEEETGEEVADEEKKIVPMQSVCVKYEQLSADERKIAWKRLDDINKDARAELKKQWKAAFVAIGEEVKSNLSQIKDKLPESKSVVTVEHLKAGIEAALNVDLFNVDKWIATMKKQSGLVTNQLAMQIIKQTLEQAGGSLPESEFIQIARRAQSFSTSKIAESINTIDSELKDVIRNTISNNPKFDKDELFDAIMGATKDKISRVYTASRAMNIATTTTTAATGNAQDNTIQKLDFEKVWMSQRDGRVRVSHFNADGKRADEEGYFNIGSDRMRHPAGGSVARENCYCRCYLFAQKKERK